MTLWVHFVMLVGYILMSSLKSEKFIDVCVCLSVWLSVCLSVCMYACMHACMHACMYVSLLAIWCLRPWWVRILHSAEFKSSKFKMFFIASITRERKVTSMFKVRDRTKQIECIKMNCTQIHERQITLLKGYMNSYTCKWFIDTSTLVCTHKMQPCMHACAHMHMHACTHTWMYDACKHTARLEHIKKHWFYRFTCLTRYIHAIYMDRCKGCWKPNGFMGTISVTQSFLILGVQRLQQRSDKFSAKVATEIR